MKIVPTSWKKPNKIKMLPPPIAVESAGEPKPINKVRNQLRKTPTATPVSFMISLMYIQTTGPGPN